MVRLLDAVAIPRGPVVATVIVAVVVLLLLLLLRLLLLLLLSTVVSLIRLVVVLVTLVVWQPVSGHRSGSSTTSPRFDELIVRAPIASATASRRFVGRLLKEGRIFGRNDIWGEGRERGGRVPRREKSSRIEGTGLIRQRL